jgi:putative transposase
MKIEINSVWQVKGVDGIEDGKYRVLDTYSDVAIVVVYNLAEKSLLKRPKLVDLADFSAGIERGDITPDLYKTPYYQLVDEESIPDKYKEKRDSKYSQIKELLAEPLLLYDLATQKRVRQVAKQTKLKQVNSKTIYRILNLYWQYGQDKNSLLPAYKESGGTGKTRAARGVKRGAPSTSRSGSVTLAPGINITEDDKDKIRKGLKKYYLKTTATTVKKAFKNTLRDYYALEIEQAVIEDTFAKVPTYRQFLYWKNKLVDSQDVITKRTTENDYLKNKRGVLGSATQNTPVPGSSFEIDATVADVHIVSEFRRNYCLGRPTIYSVIDRASRMIVGLHVSMEYASWSAARQALVNSFLPKSAYCA